MKLLLDTHALLWWSMGDQRLPKRAIRHIDAAESVCFSIVSLWEIGIKMARQGYDFPLHTGWDEFLPKKAKTHNIGMMTISPKHCRMISELPRHHGDPFDRMLIAQALDSGWSVLSKDSHFDAYGVRRLW